MKDVVMVIDYNYHACFMLNLHFSSFLAMHSTSLTVTFLLNSLWKTPVRYPLKKWLFASLPSPLNGRHSKSSWTVIVDSSFSSLKTSILGIPHPLAILSARITSRAFRPPIPYLSEILSALWYRIPQRAYA
jgi:ABC-type phosphate transport system permease subunit